MEESRACTIGRHVLNEAAGDLAVPDSLELNQPITSHTPQCNSRVALNFECEDLGWLAGRENVRIVTASSPAEAQTRGKEHSGSHSLNGHQSLSVNQGVRSGIGGAAAQGVQRLTARFTAWWQLLVTKL
jgi:hypothetical protein